MIRIKKAHIVKGLEKKTDIKINITIFEIFPYLNKDTILTKIPKVKIQIINNMIFAVWKSKYHYFWIHIEHILFKRLHKINIYFLKVFSSKFRYKRKKNSKAFFLHMFKVDYYKLKSKYQMKSFWKHITRWRCSKIAHL